jgi:hypothetical protein
MIGTCLGAMLLLYGLFFVIVRLLTVGQGTRADGRNRQTWPQLTARVTSVQVHEIESTSSFIPSSTFSVELTYEYEVNQLTHIAQQVLNGDYFHGQTSQQIADSVQELYPPGEDILISYDPQNPQVTMLGKPESKRDDQDLGYGLIFIALGGSLIVLGPLLVKLYS